MAFSGAGLWAYLILHIGGNIVVLFDGPKFNHYAEMLQTNPLLLWPERILVFGGILLHGAMGWRLTQLNKEARKNEYTVRSTSTSTFASRTMIISGLIIAAFFVFHILHFTVHVGGATYETETLLDGHVRPNAALMVHSAFKQPIYVLIYVVAQVLVFIHLYHGSVSLFQSLGMFPVFNNVWVRRGAKAFTVVLVAAALAIPLGIYFYR